jgi:spore cortex biosynthesis protein YabQ
MILSVSNQTLILLASIYGGLLLGLIFDLYRFARNTFRFGRITTIIGDIIFWAAGLALTLVIIYKSSSGLVRFYQLLGFSLGMAVYMKFISRYTHKLLFMLKRCIISFAYTFIKIIRGPVILLSNILWKPCQKIRRGIGRLFINIEQDTKKYMMLFRKKK